MVVCALVNMSLGMPEWKTYKSKNGGRHNFQIDLGIALLNYGVGLDWDGKSERPDWMPGKDFKPCDCEKCFFCLNGLTNGIAHPPTKKRKVVVEYACGTRLTTNKCTNERVNILGKCYRKQDSEMGS